MTVAESPVDYRDADRQVWEEELADFVPSRIYDTHIHLYSDALVSDEHGERHKFKDADFSTMEARSDRLYPGRETHYLVLGCPALGTDVDAHNRMMFDEVSADPMSRMNRLTTPADTPEQIERDVKELGFIGLKPYRIYSTSGDDDLTCRIRDFLPERQLEVANDLGLWVTMHLARPGGCGDEDNLSDLEEYTTRSFPNVKWILAHCGRSFSYWPIRNGIDRLRDMPNIHYDLSAVCDVRPFVTLFQKEDHRRLFYGSDGIDSTVFHGKYVTFGRGWRGLNVDNYPDTELAAARHPILAIYEELLCIKHAAEIAGLSQDQVEDVFWRNAVTALGVDWPEE